MGNLRVLVLFMVTACQAMYGAPPQKLRTPEPIKPPATLTDVATAEPFDDACELLISRAGPKPTRHPAEAEVHTQAGDQKVKAFDTAPPSQKRELIIDGIDNYAAALRQDPFSAKATLKLAVAYDKVRRRGCALALLGRLDQLAQNPKFRNDATEAIDEIEQRRTWFDGYRKDALRKVGRTAP